MGLVLNQYEIVIVNLDTTIGSEIKKTRPCVILSPNEMNKHLRTIIVAPLTTQSKSYPTRIAINYKKKKNWIVIDQIRTIDKKRIYQKKSQLKKKEIEKVKAIIKETFVD